MDTQTSPHQQTTPGTAHLASAHVPQWVPRLCCAVKRRMYHNGGGGGGGGGGAIIAIIIM